MAKGNDVDQFARKHGLVVLSIAGWSSTVVIIRIESQRMG
jgi:hypothetical protein